VLAGALAVCALALATLHFREEAVVTPAVRFTIDPPEGSSFDSFALSPDGRRLAFTANKGGHRRLWLRALDSASQQMFPGEQGYNPFWSPDSRSIGFFDLGKVVVLDVSAKGATPRRILYSGDTHASARGAWGPDGVIVFNPASYGPLRRVPARGGTPEVLRHTRGHHSYPTFLPDGRILFSVSSGSEGTNIYAGASGSPGVQLVRSGSSPVYLNAGSGQLMFLSGNTLMVQPFDRRRAAVKGEPRMLIEGVGSYSASEAGSLRTAPGEQTERDGLRGSTVRAEDWRLRSRMAISTISASRPVPNRWPRSSRWAVETIYG